jgi:uncharacterized protein YdcH (DUF465 family)
MDNGLKTILLRFPEYRERIIKQIRENAEFEDLCSDYELCVDMVKMLETETALRHSKLEEYLEIKIELELEVLRYLH